MFNVKYELPLWEETEKDDFTACLTSVTEMQTAAAN